MRENRKLQFRVQVIPGDRLLAWPRFSAPRRGAVNCVTLRPPPMRSWGPCPPLPDRGRLWSREGAEVRLDRLAAGASEPGPRFYALYALSFLQCWGGHVDQPRPAGWTGGRTGPRGPTAPQGRAAVRLRHAGGARPRSEGPSQGPSQGPARCVPSLRRGLARHGRGHRGVFPVRPP